MTAPSRTNEALRAAFLDFVMLILSLDLSF